MTKEQFATWLASLPLWPFNIGAVASGPFLLRDVSEFAGANPDWKGPIELIPLLILCTFVGCVFGAILIQWGRSETKESYQSLKERAGRAQELEDTIAENIEEIVNGIIAGFSNKLGLEADENSRISLYVDDGGDGLLSIGRVATNPNHRSVSRRVLPKNEGCVGQAWAEAWVFESEFGNDGYEHHASHFGMSPELIAGLSLQPQYLAALRIDDGPQSLAVVVFESLQPSRFNETKIKREMSAFSGYLTGTLKTLAPHYPKPLAGNGEDL